MCVIYLKRNAIQTKHKAAKPEQGRRIINEHNLLPLGANILIINNKYFTFYLNKPSECAKVISLLACIALMSRQ
jgi:hypothetical protein